MPGEIGGEQPQQQVARRQCLIGIAEFLCDKVPERSFHTETLEFSQGLAVCRQVLGVEFGQQDAQDLRELRLRRAGEHRHDLEVDLIGAVAGRDKPDELVHPFPAGKEAGAVGDVGFER